MKRILPFFLMLTACSMAPRYETPEAPIPSNFGEAAEAESGNETLNDWRLHFTDPQLQKVIEAALDHNKNLKIAALRVEEVRALYRVQRADRLPNIAANGTFTRGKQPSILTGESVTSSQYAASVGLTAFEIDLFGRVKSLSDAALSQYFATQAAHESMQISLIAETASAYIRELTLAQQEQLTLDTLKSREDTFKLDSSRLKAGVANALEIKTSEMLVGTSKARLAEVRREREQNRNVLRILVGDFAFAFESSALKVDAISFPPLKGGLPSTLIARRPDIRQAEELLKSSNANIGAARAAFFPSLSITSSIGSVSSEYADLFKSGSEVWTFMPQLNIPIFSGGRNLANLDAAHVRKNIAIVQYEQSIQNAFREVKDALVAHEQIKLQVEAQKAVRDADVERARLSQKRYERGVSNYLEYLDSQRSQFQSEQEFLRLHELRLSSDISLYKALGGGYNPAR